MGATKTAVLAAFCVLLYDLTAPPVAYAVHAGTAEFSAYSGDPSDSLASSLGSKLGRLSPFQRDEVLWLARCIYSESNLPHEQELVGWVVRNRVETRYRGATYREVVLEEKQFSAFNEPTTRRAYILGLHPGTPSLAWQRALGIALQVYEASAARRPFLQTVRHFYSPVSMEGGRSPDWAGQGRLVSVAAFGVDPHRFRFFDGVDGDVPAADGHRTLEEESSGSAGFEVGHRLLPMRPTGRVARPRRPTVRPAARSN